jgi:hypothetical protein
MPFSSEAVSERHTSTVSNEEGADLQISIPVPVASVADRLLAAQQNVR